MHVDSDDDVDDPLTSRRELDKAFNFPWKTRYIDTNRQKRGDTNFITHSIKLNSQLGKM